MREGMLFFSERGGGGAFKREAPLKLLLEKYFPFSSGLSYQWFTPYQPAFAFPLRLSCPTYGTSASPGPFLAPLSFSSSKSNLIMHLFIIRLSYQQVKPPYQPALSFTPLGRFLSYITFVNFWIYPWNLYSSLNQLSHLKQSSSSALVVFPFSAFMYSHFHLHHIVTSCRS